MYKARALGPPLPEVNPAAVRPAAFPLTADLVSADVVVFAVNPAAAAPPCCR